MSEVQQRFTRQCENLFESLAPILAPLWSSLEVCESEFSYCSDDDARNLRQFADVNCVEDIHLAARRAVAPILIHLESMALANPKPQRWLQNWGLTVTKSPGALSRFKVDIRGGVQ